MSHPPSESCSPDPGTARDLPLPLNTHFSCGPLFLARGDVIRALDVGKKPVEQVFQPIDTLWLTKMTD